MTYRKTSYSAFDVDYSQATRLSPSYSSSAVYSKRLNNSINNGPTISREYRRSSPIKTTTDFNSTRPSSFITPNRRQLPPDPKQSDYNFRANYNKPISSSATFTSTSISYGANNNNNVKINKDEDPTAAQLEFIKRLLNAHSTVDDLLRGRGIAAENENIVFKPMEKREPYKYTPKKSTTNFAFVRKWQDSTPSTDSDCVSGSGTSSSKESSPIVEDLFESENTTVDSQQSSECEGDSIDEDSIEIISEIHVPEKELIFTNSKINCESCFVYYPLSNRSSTSFNLITKNVSLKNKNNYKFGFCDVIVTNFEKAAVKQRIKLKQVLEEESIDFIAQPLKLSERNETVRRINRSRAEISVQHLSFYSDRVNIQVPTVPPPENMRIHLRLTERAPQVMTCSYVHKQTIQRAYVAKTIKIRDQRRKLYTSMSVDVDYDKSKKLEALQPNYNLKVPAVFLKDTTNTLLANDNNKNRKDSQNNKFVLNLTKSNGLVDRELNLNYLMARNTLRKIKFNENIKFNEEDGNCSFKIPELKPCPLVRKNNVIKSKSSHVIKRQNITNEEREGILSKQNILDGILIERYCSTRNIIKPATVNHKVPCLMPKKVEIVSKPAFVTSTLPRFIKYKSPERISRSEDKVIPKPVLQQQKSFDARLVGRREVREDVSNKNTFLRSSSECGTIRNVYSHSLHDFGVFLRKAKDRLLNATHPLSPITTKDCFVPKWSSGEEECEEEEEVEAEEVEEEAEEEAVHDEQEDEESKVRKNVKDFEVEDVNISEGEKAMMAAKRRHEDEEQQKLQEYEEARRIEREREEEELKILKEKQERRRLERETEERDAAEKLRLSEEKRKAEEDERKARMEADKQKKLDEAKRRTEMMGGSFAATATAGGGRNFVIPEKKDKNADKFGNIVQAKQEMGMTKEQQEEAKRYHLAGIVKALEQGHGLPTEMKEKIKFLHQRICKLEIEKYDLEKRHERQVYDLKELNERSRQVARNSALKKGVDPSDAGGRHPPKVCISSKYDRQTDRRSFKEKRSMYENKYAFPCFPNVPPPPVILEMKIKKDQTEEEAQAEANGEYEYEEEEDEEEEE